MEYYLIDYPGFRYLVKFQIYPVFEEQPRNQRDYSFENETYLNSGLSERLAKTPFHMYAMITLLSGRPMTMLVRKTELKKLFMLGQGILVNCFKSDGILGKCTGQQISGLFFEKQRTKLSPEFDHIQEFGVYWMIVAC